jgi:pyruvate ferredoxin oxidoreductase gamma subunit
MLGAVVKVSGIMSEEEFLGSMEESFKHKFASKPEVIKGNMKALKVSMGEVKICEK